MAAELEFHIKSAHLGVIKDLVPVEITKISPLNRPAGTSQEGALVELREAGVIGEDGKLNEKAALTFGALGRARASSGINFTGLPGPFEYIAYFTAGGEEALSLTVTSEGLAVECPADLAPALNLLANCMGTSNLQISKFDAVLSEEQALAWAATMDLHRRSILQTLLEESAPPTDIAFSFDDIYRQVNHNSRPAWQWIGTNLRQLMVEQPEKFTEADLGRALQELTDAGYLSNVASSGEGIGGGAKYRLVGESAMVANRFPVIKGLLQVTSSRQDNEGQVFFSEFAALQAGAFDLLHLENANGKFQIKSMTPARVFELCNLVMKDAFKQASEITATQAAKTELHPESEFKFKSKFETETETESTPEIAPETESADDSEVDSSPPPFPQDTTLAGGVLTPPPLPATELSPAENFEVRYRWLKEQFSQNALTYSQFRDEVNKLRMQDENGTWWQIWEADGRWLYWNGVEWASND